MIVTKGRNWRPFEEAREFVWELGLKSHREWQDYCKSETKPDDIPSAPDQVYSSEFKGYGDWLGTRSVRNQDRQYRPFSEAREFVRGLGLKGQKEWRDYCRSGNRPEDIPANPQGTYAAEFQGYGDWLGTGRRSVPWKPFEEAREFVQGLGLKSGSEWRDYCKSGTKPNDIPSAPNQVYGSEFKGMGDWLGTGYVAAQHRQYRPFEEARKFVRSLGLKNLREWRDYLTSGQKPADIPAHPEQAYSSEYKGLRDWLGTGSGTNSSHARTRRDRTRPYRAFEEAREFVQGLGLKNVPEWRAYNRSGRKPDDIPLNPDRVYGSKFKGYGDWLGTGFVHARDRQHKPYTEAREFVQQLGLKNAREWEAYSKSG